MSDILQYIGARYVPKFMGAWSNTTVYEALSVVDDGLGTSYISGIPVPAGTPLTDTDYWHLYGATSGAIINLQNQIDAIRDHYMTPEYFGATGDGVTDDTAALQDALNNAFVLYLPSGSVYNVTTLTLPKGHSIIGQGTIKTETRGNVLTLSGNNIIEGITFTDTLTPDSSGDACIYAEDTSNLTVANCNFNTVGNGICIQFVHCEHIKINHNSFTNYGFAGIMLQATCKFADIDFNYLYNARYNGGQHSYPICFSGYVLTEYGPAEYINVRHNYIKALFPHWEGIDSHGAKNYEVSNNVIIGTLSGMNLGSTPTSIAVDYVDANNNAIIENNYIDCGSTDVNEVPYGLQLSEQAGCFAKNAIIRNNYIKVSSANLQTTAICSAISIRGNGGSSNCEISENTINVVNRHGIAADYGKHTKLKIKNNYAESMSTSSPAYAMISLTNVDSYDDIEITGNTVESAFSGISMFQGSTTAPSGNKLIEYRDNDDKGLSSSRINYSTYPDTVLLSITSAIGITGQFKPYKGTSTTVGWLCQAPGEWVTLSGTVV